jgi:AraC-like DNA-binding protein
MKRNGLLAGALLCLLAAVILEIPFRSGEIKITPADFAGRTQTFSDSNDFMPHQGGSTSEIISITPEGVVFDFHLTDSIEWYYAGILYQPENPLDLTPYTHASITLNACSTYAMQFCLLTEEPHISDSVDAESWRHQVQVLNTSRGFTEHVLPLRNFYTPRWWTRKFTHDKQELSGTTFAQLKGIKIESGEGEMINRTHRITVKEIRFFTPVPLWVRLVQSSLAMTVCLLLFLRFGLTRKEILGQYTPVVMGNLFEKDLETITAYIGSHFTDASLSMGKVARECAMHEDKVGALLKRGYGQTFKQYLNKLRLTEAQRLLRSTDRPVQEIAFAVGYASISHFNRVFKHAFNGTPREFRSSRIFQPDHQDSPTS